jgi:hypothetical protein
MDEADSAGRDARLYGRRDARRHRELELANQLTSAFQMASFPHCNGWKRR